MRRHPRALIEAGISKERYDELRAVCRQYPAYKRRLDAARRGEIDRAEGSGRWRRPDPTGDAAAMLADWPGRWRVEVIERAAQDAAGRVVAPYLIRHVAEGRSPEVMRPPCGLRQFFQARLRFFILLDAALWEKGQ